MQTINNKITLISLLLANLLTIAMAVLFNWSALQTMWIYWWQNIVIGYFTWRRIRDLENYTPEDINIEYSHMDNAIEVKHFISYLFIGIFCFIHIAYLTFITALSIEKQDILDTSLALVCVIAFFYNHRLSYQKTNIVDQVRYSHFLILFNLVKLLINVCLRIIPMHVLIIFSVVLAGESYPLIIFLIAKTVADLAMHYVIHIDNPRLEKWGERKLEKLIEQLKVRKG